MVAKGYVLAALVCAFPTVVSATVPPPIANHCTPAGLASAYRAGMTDGSPAYQRYLKTLVREAALTMDARALADAVIAERDPVALEGLGAALAAKASHTENPELIQTLLSRARSDPNPAIRAAAVRSLRSTASVESMSANGDAVNYEQLVRDESPEVRAAVVENLIVENRDVYSGHDGALSDMAVRVAAASRDPELKSKLLTGVSLEGASESALDQLMNELRSADPQVRAAAARALGSAPGGEATRLRDALASMYRREDNPQVRHALLESIARLGLSSSVPVLKSLRGSSAQSDAEIDAWIAALSVGLQEWNLILREKARRTR